MGFLSPLLIVSAGIHGLAMLLPVPEPEEIVEEEIELPEAIAVSELPEIEVPQPEPEIAPAPVFAPTPTPAPETPPVIQQPVPPPTQPSVAIAPQKPPKPPTVEPAPTIQEPMESALENQQIESSQESSTEPIKSNSIVREYREAGVKDDTYLTPIASALAAGVYSEDKTTPLTYKPLFDRDNPVTFSLPAEDNCFSKATPVGDDSVMLQASLMIVVLDDGAGGYIDDVIVAISTGYDEANLAISSAVLDNDEAYDAVDEWLRSRMYDGNTFPFDTQGSTIAYLISPVEVTFEEHSCPSAT